ncbi:MAG: site-specific integrase [Nevskiaceae bacterium]|nr:MAG: site-specific integrase [Nevskiaceae bacterium]
MKSSSLTQLSALSDCGSELLLPDTAPHTNPELEAQVTRAVEAIRIVATPTATWVAYAKALRYVGAWMQLRLGLPLSLPVSVAHVQLFILDHFGHAERTPSPQGGQVLTLRNGMPPEVDQALVDAGYKADLGLHRMSTVGHRVTVLSWVHGEKRVTNPCQEPAVRRLLSDCRKLAKELGQSPRAKTAATQSGLDEMLATCDDSLEGKRDRALLLFGWSSGGRRRSEISLADLRDLEWMGSETAVFRMRRSKTGDDGPKPVTGEAAIALRDWLAAAKITEGALFRRLWGPKVGPRLSPHAIAAIVKKRAGMANLPGDFAGHSLRRGFVTEAGLNDLPLAQTMAMTGHRLTTSVVRYTEVGELLTGKAADLLNAGRKRR